MCTCKVGSSYNSTKIVRILYLIKNEYKWIFSLFLSCCKYILNLCIFISCANGNNSLMMSCSCKSVESFLINIIDNCICFLCFSDNTLYWSILTAVKNKEGLWGFINDEGTVAVKPQFKRVMTEFSEDLAGVKTIDGGAYIKPDGTIAFMADGERKDAEVAILEAKGGKFTLVESVK